MTVPFLSIFALPVAKILIRKYDTRSPQKEIRTYEKEAYFDIYGINNI
jgi:hypothetical protein